MKSHSTNLVLLSLFPLLMIVTQCAQPKVESKTAGATLHLPAASTEIPASSNLEQHLVNLRKQLPSKDFSIVVQHPFVVVGDEPNQVVQQRSEETIRWAVEKLKQDYFTKDPEEILDIWLFKDAVSYEKHTQQLWGERPGTPYGYYSRDHKALVMNISTGAGTLVHEIVHPFVEANFPSCPAWLNEGLGSLYERCGEEDGHIRGYVNWRLSGLQRAIKAGELSPFKELMAMDARTFYADNKGVNYAQSRYLCYYLQQKGLLVKFYKQFHSNHELDPTGFKTLGTVLKEKDLNRFQKRWEKYVMGLSEGFEVRVQ